MRTSSFYTSLKSEREHYLFHSASETLSGFKGTACLLMHKDTAHMRMNQRWKLDRNKQNSFQEKKKPSSELIHGHFEHIFKVKREWAGLTIILPLHLFSGRDLLRSSSDLFPRVSVCRRAVCFPLQHQLQMECCVLLYCCHLLSNLNLSQMI